MSDIDIRIEGAVGRITLTRPKALNALTYEMCLAIERALHDWRADISVALVLVDASGDRAFCAGGDIAELYSTGTAGDFAYGRRFWRDEYRLNAKLAEYPKPVVTLMQGFVMGGGVGIGCHASQRVVCESSQISMPECNIGLVPDVGGSLLLARADGRLGEYLGTTAARMGPQDAIFAGFADHFVPKTAWPALIETLIESGDAGAVARAASLPPAGELEGRIREIDIHFDGEALGDMVRSLEYADTDFARETLKELGRSSPLSMAAAVQMVHRLRGTATIRDALTLEYRFTYRAMEHGDFLEGVRAAIIDKDRSPQWRHRDMAAVPGADVAAMLMPLGPDGLTFEETDT